MPTSKNLVALFVDSIMKTLLLIKAFCKSIVLKYVPIFWIYINKCRKNRYKKFNVSKNRYNTIYNVSIFITKHTLTKKASNGRIAKGLYFYSSYIGM